MKIIIGSSRGYVKGNVAFVAARSNLAKNAFSDEDVVTFCQAVAAHTGGPGPWTEFSTYRDSI